MKEGPHAGDADRARFDREVRPSRVVCSWAWPEDPGHLEETGIRTRICDLRLGIQPVLAGLKHLNRLEQATGKKFGDPSNPLLLSVRSGSSISQPGMMDTPVP